VSGKRYDKEQILDWITCAM